MSNPPPPTILPVLQKLKAAYLLWYEYQKLPKLHRYTLGNRIDALFIDVIEAAGFAGFLQRSEKQPWVRLAIRKLDTVKLLLMVLWETNSFETKRYAALSIPLEEVGRMLGGWNGQLTKQNQAPHEGGAGE